MSENAVMMARTRPEVFQDDGFLPDLELDIISTRPEYAEGWKEKLIKRLHKCDVWKVLPTLLVSNAFSLSITVLTTCSLASVSTTDEVDPISFGLWSYTDPDRLANGTIFNPIQSQLPSQACHPYDFTLRHQGQVDNLGLTLDSKFRTARAFGVLTVCIGFLSMSALWMGVVRDYDSTTNWRRWVGGSLLLCCFFQGMTLIVLQSEVCDFGGGDCDLATGANWVIASCVLWFCSGLLLVKWPRAKEYTHSSLAADESEEGNHEYPAEVAGEDDGVWSGFLKSLGSEEVEMIEPYRDNPEEGGDNNGGRPAGPQQSSSLRDLFSSFDSELNVTFEPAKTNAKATPKLLNPPPPPPSPPAEPLTPQSALEQLRQKSTIQATKPPPPRTVTPPSPEEEVEDATHGGHNGQATKRTPDMGSRDSLKGILDAFNDDSL